MQGGSAVTALVVIVGMILPLIALGIVCWIFVRAKRAEDAAEKEGKWRNVRSS